MRGPRKSSLGRHIINVLARKGGALDVTLLNWRVGLCQSLWAANFAGHRLNHLTFAAYLFREAVINGLLEALIQAGDLLDKRRKSWWPVFG